LPPRCCHGSCGRNRRHARRAGGDQDRRARLQRRTGRHHIIHQHETRAHQPRATARSSERLRARHGVGAFGVLETRGSRQTGLGRAAALPPQGAPYRHAQVDGDVVRLIEATIPQPPPVHRDGHDGVRAGERLRAIRAHPPRQHRRDHPALAVFECMDHVTE